MIIVGNPELLQKDCNWYQLIKYCKEMKVVAGQSFEVEDYNTDGANAPEMISYDKNVLHEFNEKLNKLGAFVSRSSSDDSFASAKS